MVATLPCLGIACSPEGGIELGQATSDERIDPCSLLDVEEVSAVAGVALGDAQRPREHEVDGQAVCNWEDHRSAMVHLQLYEGDGTERFEQLRSELEEIGEAHDVDVAGADAAYDDPSQGIVGMLVGEHFVQVGIWGIEANDAQHLELAELVAGRL